jgi:hypothetical protein
MAASTKGLSHLSKAIKVKVLSALKRPPRNGLAKRHKIFHRNPIRTTEVKILIFKKTKVLLKKTLAGIWERVKRFTISP